MDQQKFKTLHYTIDVKKFKSMGYSFQKLYARNYKAYHKIIDEYDIWLWVKDKIIEINDWHSNTSNIINFYKENLDIWKVENDKLPRPRSYMALHINDHTGEIKHKDYNEYYKCFTDPTYKLMDEYHKKYEEWREINIMIGGGIDLVLNEIKILTET